MIVRHIGLTTAGTTLPLLAGCAAPGTSVPITPRLISGKALIVWTAHAYRRDGILVVHGMVRSPRSARGAPPGRLRIVVHFTTGAPPVAGDARWRAISPRGSRVGAYEARLAIPGPALTGISDITVSYVAGDEDASFSGIES